jgi:hypothetical protein
MRGNESENDDSGNASHALIVRPEKLADKRGEQFVDWGELTPSGGLDMFSSRTRLVAHS